MKIKKFDKAAGRLFAEALQQALKDVAEKHGVVLKLTKFEYDNDRTCNYKFSAIAIGDGTAPATPEAVEWEQYHSLFRMEKDDLGTEVTINRERHIIVGLKMSSRRFPILARRLRDNKTFKYEAITVAAALDLVKKRPEHDCSSYRTWVGEKLTRCAKCGTALPTPEPLFGNSAVPAAPSR